MSDSTKKALVLIPCSATKQIGSPGGKVEPVRGISPLRERLRSLIAKTPELAGRPENQRGILDANAPLTVARTLYSGKFYQYCPQALSRQYDNVDILIVSAFYGLAQLEESLAKYNLEMKDALGSGQKIHQFWADGNLSDVLRQYVHDHGISFVWSLLPNSTDYPYHQTLASFWSKPEDVKCYHVKVYKAEGKPAGSGSGQKRGEWLNEVLTTDPGLLCLPSSLPNGFQNIKGFSFCYVPA